MGQNQSHHVSLDYYGDFSADVAGATGLQSLRDAAVKCFPVPKDGHELAFFAPGHVEISSDQQLHELAAEAMKLAADEEAEVVVEPADAEAHNNSSSSSSNNNSSFSLKKKSKKTATAPPAVPDFVFQIAVEERPKGGGTEVATAATKPRGGGREELQEEYYEQDAALPEEEDISMMTRAVSEEMMPLAAAAAAAQDRSHRVADVVFVGAGPVGLWTAIQLKIRAPHLRIVMLEKYATYQRSHVVLLEKNSMWWRPSHESLGRFVASLPGAVRTNVLESGLNSLALEVGVKIVIRKVDDVAQVVRDFRPLAVVGSDGSHSVVRTSWMRHGVAERVWAQAAQGMLVSPPDLSEDSVIDRTVMLKYERLSGAGKLSSSQLYTLQKLLPASFGLWMHVGKPRGGGGGDESSKSKKMSISTFSKKKSSNNNDDHGDDDDAAQQQQPPPPPPVQDASGTPATAPVVIIINGISAEVFDTIKFATFRNPLRPPGSSDSANDDKWAAVHPHLRGAIMGVLQAMDTILGETRDASKVGIAPVPLRNYRARWFAECVEMPADGAVDAAAAAAAAPAASSSSSSSSSSVSKGFFSSFNATAKQIGSAIDGGVKSVASTVVGGSSNSNNLTVPTFVVGDSASGVPFFRAINNGFLAGSRLANVLKDALGDATEVANDNLDTRKKLAAKLKSAVNSYHMYMVMLSAAEFTKSNSKVAFLTIGRGFTGLSAKNPLQVITFDEAVEKAVRAAIDHEAGLGASDRRFSKVKKQQGKTKDD